MVINIAQVANTMTSQCKSIDLLLELRSQSNPAHGWLDEEQAFHSCEKDAIGSDALDGWQI